MGQPTADAAPTINPEELELSARKGRIGELAVSLVAAHAGFMADSRIVDRDGCDLSIRSKRSPFPTLDFQVKCTHDGGSNAEHLTFRLKVAHYEQLRAETIAPRFLAVLVVPRSPSNWLRQSRHKLSLRKCCYWLRTTGLPATQNASSVTLKIPRANILDCSALSLLMEHERASRRCQP
jgi:Domain of unknown function (DUF4365)